jgi:glucosaminylphosphatidylinositol acyltransferase
VRWLSSSSPSSTTRSMSSNEVRSIMALSVEAATLLAPLILCESNLLYPYGVQYLLFLFCLGLVGVLYVFVAYRNSLDPARTRSIQSADMSLARRESVDYITVYRSGLLYLTFVAILAVDFRFFPRRFVKTEEKGYSLMDAGAASFVFARGLVSSRSKQRRQQQQNQQHKHDNVTKLFRRVLPLLFMGCLRLLTHQELEYQEHHTEYGVHWNFFFTLVWVEIWVHTSPNCADPATGWILPTIMIALYQMALSLGALQYWILTSPRVCPPDMKRYLWGCNILYANREGILGCIGFSSLFLFAEWISSICIWQSFANFNNRPPSTRQWNGRLCFTTTGAAVVWLLLTTNEIEVSRRSTNAVFVAWIVTLNLVQLSALQCIDTVIQYCENTIAQSTGDPVSWPINNNVNVLPPIFTLINRYGLVMFVIANLLTGAVNLSINTMDVADPTGFAILYIYVFLIGIIATFIGILEQRFLKMKTH